MLRVDPRMIPRLYEMESDLITRRKRAESEGWRGEIEGIGMTLTYLRDKREQAGRQARKIPITLAIPTIPPRC